MRGAHVALLVEDEAQIAAEMRDHLVAIGHRVVEARTMEEALQRAEIAPLCYALVDLQIPVSAESLRARPEAGVTLIERLRMRFPSRRGARGEALAIVAVSGHAKEVPWVVEAMNAGANDFLTKPLGAELRSKVARALRLTEREDHAVCEEAHCGATDAHTTNAIAPAAAQQQQQPIVLGIPAVEHHRRVRITIDDHTVEVMDTTFLRLLKLVAARLQSEEGWVHKNELGARPDVGWHGMSELHGEVRAVLPEGSRLYENNGSGCYRLGSHVEIGCVDWDGLTRIGGVVARLAEEIRRRLARPRADVLPTDAAELGER